MSMGNFPNLDSIGRAIGDAYATAIEGMFYSVYDPVDAASNTGEFVIDEATQQWNNIRDTFGQAQQQINFITNIIDTPCEDKWDLLVELAYPAAGESLVVLLVPSPGEVAEEFLQPKYGKGKGRGGSANKRIRRMATASGRVRRAWPTIPDIDKAYASLIPGAQAIEGRKVGAGEAAIFKGIDIADQALWYWLLLDIGKTFTYKWSSNIMEARFCSKPWEHIMEWESGFSGDPNDFGSWIMRKGSYSKEKNVENTEQRTRFTISPNNYVPANVHASTSFTIRVVDEGGNGGAVAKPRVNVTLEDGTVETLSGPEVDIPEGGTRAVPFQFSKDNITDIADASEVVSYGGSGQSERLESVIFMVGRTVT